MSWRDLPEDYGQWDAVYSPRTTGKRVALGVSSGSASNRGTTLGRAISSYSTEELKTKKSWGHSSYEQALQVAEMAGVKRLAITHHDPDHDDVFLRRMEQLCQERFQQCVLARDGMEIEV